MADDPYQVLNLASDATLDAVEKAYRSMASRWHPDLHPAARRVQAEEQMKRINAAAELLLDTNRRTIYDRERQTQKAAETTAVTVAHAPLADTTMCHLHPARPRLHYCVGCRNALCAECMQIVGGWSWCPACAAVSKKSVSLAPVYGDNSIGQEWIRREQYRLSPWGKINLALSIVALALWLFGIWGPGFVRYPFAIGLVMVAVFAASGAFHFALLRATSLFWNTHRTVPKFVSSLASICLALMIIGGSRSVYYSVPQMKSHIAAQQEQNRFDWKNQKSKEIRDKFLAMFQDASKQQKTLEEKVADFLEGRQDTKINENTIDFTALPQNYHATAEHLAEKYLYSDYADEKEVSETRAMFLSFLVYTATNTKKDRDKEATLCLTITRRPEFKLYCWYYQAICIQANPKIKQNQKITEMEYIVAEMNKYGISPTDKRRKLIETQLAQYKHIPSTKTQPSKPEPANAKDSSNANTLQSSKSPDEVSPNSGMTPRTIAPKNPQNQKKEEDQTNDPVEIDRQTEELFQKGELKALTALRQRLVIRTPHHPIMAKLDTYTHALKQRENAELIIQFLKRGGEETSIAFEKGLTYLSTDFARYNIETMNELTFALGQAAYKAKNVALLKRILEKAKQADASDDVSEQLEQWIEEISHAPSRTEKKGAE